MRKPPYKNLSYILVGRVLEIVLGLVLFGAIARVDPAMFGAFYLASNVALIVVTATELGFSRYAMHAIATDAESMGPVLGRLVALRTTISACVVAILAALMVLVGVSSASVGLTTLLCAAAVVVSVADLLHGAFRAHEDMLVPVVLVAAQRAIYLGLALLGLWLGLDLLWVASAALGCSVLLLAATAVVLAQRYGTLEMRLDLKILPSAASGIIWFVVPAFFGVVIGRVGLALMYLFSDENGVAMYGSARCIVDAVLVFAFAAGTAAFPKLVAEFGASDADGRIASGSQAVFKSLLAFVLPVAIGTSLVGEDVLVVVFGSDYADAANMLGIGMWVAVAIFGNSFATTVLQATGRARLGALLAGPLLVLSVLTGLVLVPLHMGLGAMWAALIAESILLVVHLMLLRRLLNLHAMASALLRVLIAAAPMAASVAMLEELGLTIRIVTGVVVYVVAIASLRLFSPADLTWLRETVGDRGAAGVE